MPRPPIRIAFSGFGRCRGSRARARTSIYVAMQRDEFPRSIAIGSRSVAWLESEIRPWMAARVNASRAGDAGRVA